MKENNIYVEFDANEEYPSVETMETILKRTSDKPILILEGDSQYLNATNNGLSRVYKIINGSNFEK